MILDVNTAFLRTYDEAFVLGNCDAKPEESGPIVMAKSGCRFEIEFRNSETPSLSERPESCSRRRNWQGESARNVYTCVTGTS